MAYIEQNEFLNTKTNLDVNKILNNLIHRILEYDDNENMLSFIESINLNNSIKELESIMKIVFQHNGVSLIAWQNWTNQFKKLKSFYGI
jgi:hypothetical protein